MYAARAKGKVKATDGLALGGVLGLLFLALCFLRVIGDTGSGLFDGRVRIAPLEQSIWGMQLAYRLAGFAGSLLLVHIMLGVGAWAMAWLTVRAWPSNGETQRVWTCIWMILAVIWILAANAAWFPSSSLGNPYAELVRVSVAGVSVFHLVSFALVASVGATIARLIWRHRDSVKALRPTVYVPAAIVLMSASGASLHDPTAWIPSTAAPTRPNVIVIGIDSVRAEISQGGAHGRAPELQQFLRDATVFDDTTTPLARTYAAWVSILTGRHPHTTGATVNLLPRDLIETGETLPQVLREADYATVYGIDEVRFSNIDESYGFDRIVGPRMGSADFLIEFFGDTPLSNLLVNTRLGDTLFPELHGNRAAKVLYDPDTFVRDLEHHLYFGRPTFLAVHLTLPHWPYLFAASEPRLRGSVQQAEYPELYAAAIERVDRQFADLMAMLERKGALENAIVVVLSDHGESLGEASPLSGATGHVPPLLGDALVYGHGTHVFSEEQYKVLLAFRAYGETPLQPLPGAAVGVPSSLEDITPTLLDALDLESADPFDGRSLMASLGGRVLDEPAIPADRIRFLETEFNPPGVSIGQAISASAISAASTSYRIDPRTDRVEIRPEQLQRILETRQFAAVSDDRWLVSVPAARSGRQHLIYIGSKNGRPIWLAAPPSTDSDPAQLRLWAALRDRFEPVARRPIMPKPSVGE